MSSSSRHSSPLLLKLLAFNNSCDKYQARLLELISNDKRFHAHEIFVIIEALDYERTPAGSLAGLMDIQWNGSKWSLGKTDFIKKLDPEIQESITNQLNSLEKKNFSEDDLRIILQNILISYKSSVFIDQYKILCEIKQLLNACIETNNEDLRKTLLKELNNVVTDNREILENLMLPSSSITLFLTKPKTFLSEANEILNETDLTIHHRAS